MNSLTVLKLSVLVALVNAAARVPQPAGDLDYVYDGERRNGTLKDLLKGMHLERAINPFKGGVENIMVVGPAVKATKALLRKSKSGCLEAVGEGFNCAKDGATLVIIGNCVAPAATAGAVGATVAGSAAGIATVGSIVGGGLDALRDWRQGERENAAVKGTLATLEAITAGLAGLPRFDPLGKSAAEYKLLINTGEFLRNLVNRCRDDGTLHSPVSDTGDEPVKRAALEMLADAIADGSRICLSCAQPNAICA